MLTFVRFAISFAAVILLVSCSTVQKKSPSQKSAERLVSFVETGDSTFLYGIFSDSVLKLMSIEGMVATREDFVQSLGELKSVDGPEFTSDSTAKVTMRFEEMSLVSSLEFNEQGEIRFLSIHPEPVKSSGEMAVDTNIADITSFADFCDAFNTDTNYIRLVSILSPTCPMCRDQGFSAVQSVLRSVPSSSLRTYIIWLPALPSDTRQDAILASAEYSDARVNYFWDPEMVIANPFGKKLGLSRFAWDVYMLYDRGEKWKKNSPGEPYFWMHQLMGAEELAPTLDSVVLQWKTEALIPKRGL